MDNVVNIFNRRKLPFITAEIDREAAEFGRYIGVLPKYPADDIREMTRTMEVKRAQIERLMEEFKVLWEGYYFYTVAALSLMGVSMEEFNHERDELYVDRGGHCWLVDTEKRDAVPKE